MSLKRNDSMVFSESTRTERAGESDASERSEHEGSDDDDEAGGSPEGTSPGAARPPAGVSPEEGEAGAALLLSLTDPASLLLGLTSASASALHGLARRILCSRGQTPRTAWWCQ